MWLCSHKKERISQKQINMDDPNSAKWQFHIRVSYWTLVIDRPKRLGTQQIVSDALYRLKMN